MEDNTAQLHTKVKRILYSLTGITLTDNKEIMISNRLHKLKRNTGFEGDIYELLNLIEKEEVYISEFINTFTTNKTHFFREDFHFEDLRDRVLPSFSGSAQEIKMYCSASSTGEEPYSMAMTVMEANKLNKRHIRASIMATDIDTNVLKYASDGIYRFSKSSKEFPSWVNPRHYFKRRVKKGLASQEVLIKANDELKRMIIFKMMNLNDDNYPFSPHQFDVIFCRNVLIYFKADDQKLILKKLFKHLKIGGTLYIGHSEHPHDLIDCLERVGQNIFVKVKDFN